MGVSTQPGEGRATRRRMPREAREQQMLDVAEGVFARRGYQRASMQEIAEGVGVSATMLFSYFRSKDGLFVATAERARRRMAEHLTRAMAAGDDPREQLAAASDAFFAMVERERDIWRVLAAEGPANAVIAEGLAEMRASDTLLIGELLRRAAPREADERELSVVARMLEGAGFAAGLWWLDHPEVPREWIAERFARTAGRLIGDLTRSP